MKNPCGETPRVNGRIACNCGHVLRVSRNKKDRMRIARGLVKYRKVVFEVRARDFETDEQVLPKAQNKYLCFARRFNEMRNGKQTKGIALYFSECKTLPKKTVYYLLLD